MDIVVQEEMNDKCYDTIHNFLRFHDLYRDQNNNVPVDVFYRSYTPPLPRKHFNCVGLALRLRDRVQQYVGAAAFLASCEELLEFPHKYASVSPPPAETAEKEHVLVAVRVDVAGRPGVILMDPGYHVSRVVTVMADKKLPHSGFYANSTPGGQQEYQYSLDQSGDYVWWRVRKRRGSKTTSGVSLVYIGRPFLSLMQHAERRNLVFPFKTWLRRDRWGRLDAGLYFSLTDPRATLFYRGGGGGYVEEKIPLPYFSEEGPRQGRYEEVVEECDRHLEDVREVLEKVARIFQDTEFLQEIARIEKNINIMSDEN